MLNAMFSLDIRKGWAIFLNVMNRLAGMFQIGFKRCILNIIGAILFNVLIAQPLKLTLELKGAGSTGDTFLHYEPIYPVLTAKNVSTKKQQVLDIRFDPSVLQDYLKRFLIKNDNETLQYNKLFRDDFFHQPKESDYLVTLLPGDSIVSEIGELMVHYYALSPSRYRMSVKWRKYVSNEVQFIVETLKGDSLKAFNLYREAVIISDYPFSRIPVSYEERKRKELITIRGRIRGVRDIIEKFKNEKIALEPFFVLTQEVLLIAIHRLTAVMDTVKASELFYTEHKKLIEEHPNTFLAQKRVKQTGVHNKVFAEWKDKEKYFSWLQYLTEKYQGTLVGKEAYRILESKKEKSEK
jgi:hypothetical protein